MVESPLQICEIAGEVLSLLTRFCKDHGVATRFVDEMATIDSVVSGLPVEHSPWVSIHLTNQDWHLSINDFSKRMLEPAVHAIGNAILRDGDGGTIVMFKPITPPMNWSLSSDTDFGCVLAEQMHDGILISVIYGVESLVPA